MQKQTLSFPLLSDAEILSILKEADFQITKSEIDKPQSEKIKQIFSFFIESCELRSVQEIQLINQDIINNIFRVSNQEVHVQSVPLITIYLQLKSLFASCSVNDFNLQDLQQPSKKRFTLLFSALTNFLRFKSMLGEILSDLVQKFQSNKDNLQIFYLALNEKQQEFTDYNQQSQSIKSELNELSKIFKDKKFQIAKMQNQLKTVTQEVNQLKQQITIKARESHQLENVFQNINASIQQIQQKIISPDAFQRMQAEILSMQQEITQIEPRRNELQNATIDVQQHILKQTQLLQDLDTLEEFTEKTVSQKSQLAGLQEIMNDSQVIIQQFLEEKAEVENLIKNIKIQLLDVNQKDKQFLEISARNDFSDVYTQLKREQIMHDEEVCQCSDQIENSKLFIQEIQDQISGIKTNCLAKQQKLVGSLNDLLRGYVAQMQEMSVKMQ